MEQGKKNTVRSNTHKIRRNNKTGIRDRETKESLETCETEKYQEGMQAEITLGEVKKKV